MYSPRFFPLATTVAIGIIKMSVVVPPAIAETKTPPIDRASGNPKTLVAPSTWQVSPHSPARYVPLLVLPIALGIAIWMIKDKNI